MKNTEGELRSILEEAVPIIDRRIALRGVRQDGPDVLYAELVANTADDGILLEHAYRCESGDSMLPTFGFRIILLEPQKVFEKELKSAIYGAIYTFQSKLDGWLN